MQLLVYVCILFLIKERSTDNGQHVYNSIIIVLAVIILVAAVLLVVRLRFKRQKKPATIHSQDRGIESNHKNV